MKRFRYVDQEGQVKRSLFKVLRRNRLSLKVLVLKQI